VSIGKGSALESCLETETADIGPMQAPSFYSGGDSKVRFYKMGDEKVIKWGRKKLQNYDIRRNILRAHIRAVQANGWSIM